MKKLAVPAALVVAAVAFGLAGAQHAKGDGVARNRERTGEFHFVAAKVVRGDQERVEGNLRFACTDKETLDGVRITIPAVKRMGVVGNKAEFGGPAVMRFRVRAGVKEIRGHAVVVAIDNKKPDQGQDARPDVFSIKFTGLEGRPTYAFEAPVQRGDIVVAIRDGAGG